MTDWEDAIPDELRVEIDRDEVRTDGLPLDVVCKRREVPSSTVIYFLCRNEKIVYVGRSTKVYARIEYHQRDKYFDSWAYFEVEDVDLAAAIERALIRAVDPEYNDYGSSTSPRTDNELLEFLASVEKVEL